MVAPSSTRPLANSTTPVLSDTLINAWFNLPIVRPSIVTATVNERKKGGKRAYQMRLVSINETCPPTVRGERCLSSWNPRAFGAGCTSTAYSVYTQVTLRYCQGCRPMPFPLIATLVVVFLTVAFSLQNDQTVSIQFFEWTFEGSLVLVLLTTLCLGIVIHILASMPARIRKSKEIAELTKRVTELEGTPPSDVSRPQQHQTPYLD
ncbi:MAG: LapA family protein [Nitrospira sp. SB0666_bin_27]|nr:LapA family protein [Nitrospira sp. SB0666_bin_27]MYF25155.1 LapA family protein [Nitrospira sp. SB0678_bin_10]